jgi:hypothetical protein
MVALEASRAYFDESRIDEQFPVVAGFWASIEKWENCEREISEALLDKPLHVKKAKKYLRGYPLKFANILNRHNLLPVYSTVERSFFGDIWELQGDGDIQYADPYTTCAFNCCQMLDILAQQRKWQPPTRIVFDDNEGDPRWANLDLGYRDYIAGHPNSLLSKTASFEDDEDTLPLLAADFYAWLLSRKFNRGLVGEEFYALQVLNSRERLLAEVTNEKFLKQWGLEEVEVAES